MNHALVQALRLPKKSIVSVVGAGGKTSLIRLLANTLEGHILVCPSTKFLPFKEPWQTLVREPITWQEPNQVIVAADHLIQGKLAGISPYALESDYNYLLIEADGSRRLPLKGWGPHEPVVMEATTCTIGVVDLQTLGMKMSHETIYRYDDFLKMTDEAKQIGLNHLKDMILHPGGLFKEAKGKKILLLNKVESQEALGQARILKKRLLDHPGLCPFDQILFASVLNNQVVE